MINKTNVDFSPDIVEQIKTIESESENQFNMLEKERLIMIKIPINAMIKKNNFSVLKSALKTKPYSETLPTSSYPHQRFTS